MPKKRRVAVVTSDHTFPVSVRFEAAFAKRADQRPNLCSMETFLSVLQALAPILPVLVKFLLDEAVKRRRSRPRVWEFD